MTVPELFDINLWIAATPQRREQIVEEVSALLPDFEFITLRTYPGPGQNKLIPVAAFGQKKTGVLFHLIPGGTFRMGFSDEEGLALQAAAIEAELTGDDAEQVEIIVNQPVEMQPVHEVTLPPFLIARFPLRLTEACTIVGADFDSDEVPYAGEFDFDLAVFFVESLDDFLSISGYILPTEAQWEYACRCLTMTPFWWGETLPTGSEWTEDIDNAAEINRCSNSFGLVNMPAFPELCADKWHDSYENAPIDGSAWTEDASEPQHVVRGGGALLYPWQGVGEWLAMLSSARCTTDVSDIGLAMRPVYPLPDRIMG